MTDTTDKERDLKVAEDSLKHSCLRLNKYQNRVTVDIADVELVLTALEVERQRADELKINWDAAEKSIQFYKSEISALKGDHVPVAYMHTLHMEAGQSEVVLSAGVLKSDPFGMRGKDYDNSYTVTTKSLFTAPQKPVEPDDATVLDWGERNDIKGDVSRLRCLIDDAATLPAAIEASGGIVKDGE